MTPRSSCAGASATANRIARQLQRGAVLAATAVLSILGAATPAGAHAQLVNALPAADSVLATAPEQVQLTFDESVSTVGQSVISVVGPDGTTVDDGNTAISGVEVTVGLRPLTVAGGYTVSYRVVSGDGHIVNDSYSFVYQPVDALASPLAANEQSAQPPLGVGNGATNAAGQTTGGLDLSLTKVVVLVGFIGLYVVTSRWLKAYRRRSLGR